MRTVDVEGLVAGSSDPFVHHQLDLASVERAWLDGPAAVVEHRATWPDAPPDARAMLCLGPAVALDPLLAGVGAEVPTPWRVVVEAASEPALPPGWRPVEPMRWHWMTTHAPPDADGATVEVEEAPGDEVDAVLDDANPGSFARPGSPGVEVWLGARAADGRLAAVGALLRQHDGTGHLRGITTRAAYRGRGLAAAVSGELTRRALVGGSGVATLGVYTDNEVAIGLYRRLGYAITHTFTAGLTAG